MITGEIVPPLVVELCGLPGAGKTTLAQTLVDHLRQDGLAATLADAGVSADADVLARTLRKVAATGRVVGAGPLHEFGAALLLGTGQPGIRDAVAIPVKWWVARHTVARSQRRDRLSVVEEGLVQALWSARLRSHRSSVADLVDLARTVCRPDLVVQLRVPPEVALARLRSRDSRHSRVQRLAPSEQLSAMHSGETLMRDLLHEWSRRGLSDVAVLDASSDDPLADLLGILRSHRPVPSGTGMSRHAAPKRRDR